MKKFIGIGIAALAGIALVSCGNTDERVVKKDVIGLNDESEIVKLDSCDILFKKDSEVPYISLDEGVRLMSDIRSGRLDDEKYQVMLNVH